MAFKCAEDLMEAGFNGKWYKPSNDFEREVLISSIAGDNLKRGSKGQPSLRHYEQDGHIAVSDGGNIDPHPNDRR